MMALKSPSSLTWPRRRVVHAWLSMTIIAVGISLLLGEGMRRGVFDAWQAASPRDLSRTDVRVVMIDGPSIEDLGAWPWPRYYLARLTEQLAARNAKVIGFDILFSEHDRVQPDTFVSLYPELSSQAATEVSNLQSMDSLFGQVVGKSPVVLGHAGADEAISGQPPIASSGAIRGTPPAKLASWNAELAAIPELDDVALGHGLMNARPDGDGVIRSVPLLLRAAGKIRPGFALEIAHQVAGGQGIMVTPATVRVGRNLVPVDRHGQMLLHFGMFPQNRIYSASNLIANNAIPMGEFADKPVIIGLSAEGTTDIAATPLAAEEYGPLVQAQAVDAMLTGGWLSRPVWGGVAEWVVAALLSVLALGMALFGRAYRVMLAIVFIGLPLGSWIAFQTSSLLLDPARPLTVGAGAVGGVALGLFALARLERARLRDALVQERIAAAETAGELEAARAIQLAMVPRRSTLQTIDRRVDLDALLEPAKTVGGDYYDAVKVGPHQVRFAVADVTGKGVPAALFMAMSKALSGAALSSMEENPSRMAEIINAELLKDNSEVMSVTMLLGNLDLKSGVVSMVSAGHDDPLLLSSEGDVTRVRLTGGPPFCVADLAYPAETLTLKAGDTLVLVTDGVTEAQDAAGQLFGRNRILATRAENESATAVCERIRDEVRTFEEGTEATDDLTVMAIRYFGADV